MVGVAVLVVVVVVDAARFDPVVPMNCNYGSIQQWFKYNYQREFRASYFLQLICSSISVYSFSLGPTIALLLSFIPLV